MKHFLRNFADADFDVVVVVADADADFDVVVVAVDAVAVDWTEAKDTDLTRENSENRLGCLGVFQAINHVVGP